MRRTLCNLAVLATLATIGTAGAGAAHAGEEEGSESLRNTTLNLIRLLVDEKIITQEKADALIRDAQRVPAPTPPTAAAVANGAKTVRVPYVPETVKKEIREQLKQEVLAQARSERWAEPNAVPEWVDRIKLEGDIRLRYQQDRFQDTNVPESLTVAPGSIFPELNGIDNTTDDRNRFRVRARLGVLAKVGDYVSAGLRLATGNTSDPVSTNQTLGNTSNKYQFLVDRAYVKLDPYEWLSFSGGRIPNPWLSTDLVWDDDLNFEGAALSLLPRINQDLSGFFTLGAFALQDIAPNQSTSARNKWLYGAQGGLDWVASGNARLKVGVALYDYQRVEGIANTGLAGSVEAHRFDATAPQFRQKGNSVFNINVVGDSERFGLASQFREANLTAVLDLAHFDPVHVVVQGDYVKNLGFDRTEILQRTGVDIEPKTTGYQAKVSVGMPQLRRRHDWQVSLGYRYLERDAVLDAFTDSDFRLGGTDAKGYVFAGGYGLDKNTSLNLRWLSGDAIDGPPLSIDVLQLDLNARF